jgi:peptidoglycan/LPS O-acetylase OafA/YrhL
LANERSKFSANNFDLLRFAFASTVMLVHCHVLSKQPSLAFLSDWLSSDVAVKAFFVVSGLLVTMSYERSRSLASYADKRLRRIYPAYLAVVAGCAVLLFALSTVDVHEYVGGAARYLAANLAFLNFVHPALPGVFESNPWNEVNGALWTLKIEVMFYVAVPLIAWLGSRVGRLPVVAGLYLASVAYFTVLSELAQSTNSPLYVQLARQLPGQLSYFMVGAFFFYYFDFFARHAIWFGLVAAGLGVLSRFYPIAGLEPLWLGTLVVYFGFFFYAGNFGRYGDFSYGIYILHFPIIQTLVWLGLFAWSPYAALGIVCVLVVVAAAAMWHFVEKRFLNRSSHYVEATRTEAASSSSPAT